MLEAEVPADLPEMYRDLAWHLDRHFDANQKRLEQLFWLLRAASSLLVADIVLWLIILAGR
jgi:hypothetical protein